MPFCFKRKESVAEAVRRLCSERLDAAVECLQQADHLEGVHAARKEIKKLRAVLRLLREEIGEKNYQRLIDELRIAANRLAPMRDAHVLLNAFEELAIFFSRELPAGPLSEIKSALRQNCLEQEKRFLEGDSIPAVTAILRRLKHCVGKLNLEGSGWAAVSPGLKKTYRCGREALAVARQDRSAENFHEWRKRVKDLRHHLRLLCPAHPKKLCAAADELESLGNFLGDDHDLFMLSEFAGEKAGRAGRAKLLRLILRRQKEFRAAALEAGEKFYSDKPKEFCARVEDYWKSWRGKK